MIEIRPYRQSDYGLIKSWWDAYKACPPLPGMMVEDGTFVLELNGTPALSLTVLGTQSKQIAYVEGYIKNPDFMNVSLEEYGSLLWNYCFEYAKKQGYARVFCYCLVDKLGEKYARYGMSKTAEHLSAFVRDF